MSHVPYTEPGVYRLIIELPPIQPDNSNVTVTSGPHENMLNAGFVLGKLIESLRACKMIQRIQDTTIRLVEQGGDCRIWEYCQGSHSWSIRHDHQQYRLALAGGAV
ncbi:MAG: hypothetical protein JKX85_00570 [Phycisphaeraceae bacterium]|nr:hypothetical protein [Phycisphaeraceae bacterium]